MSERVEVPTTVDPAYAFVSAFRPKTREQILSSMIAILYEQMGQQIDVRPGSVLNTLLEVVTMQLVSVYQEMNTLHINYEAKLNTPVDFIPINLAMGDRAFECETKCECGMETHGFANHSTWCKKWTSSL